MSPASFLTLMAASAASLVVAAVAVVTQPDLSAANLGGGGPMLPALSQHVGDVARLSIDYPGYRLALRRSGDGWLAAEMGDYPVRANLAGELLTNLAGMTRIEPKTTDPGWFGYIRVGGPEAAAADRGIRVTAVDAGDGVLADIVLGRASASIGYTPLGGTFVRPFDEQQAWLAEGSVTVPAALTEWFEPLFSLPGLEIRSVALLRGGDVQLEVEKPDPGVPNYELIALDPGVAPQGSTADDEAIRSLLQVVVSVTLEDARARAEVGVPPDARVLRFTTVAGLSLDVTLAGSEDERWVLFDASAPDGSEAAATAAAITARTGQWAFRLPERRMALLETPAETLVLPPGVAPDLPTLPLTPLPLPGQ